MTQRSSTYGSIIRGRRTLGSAIRVVAPVLVIAFLMLVAGDARADGPNSTCKCAGCASTCGGGGCTPTEQAVDIYDVKMTAESTNTTLSWSESPAGSSTTLYWSNSSEWDVSEFSQGVSGSGSYSVFLDYLEPSTTYDYEILAQPPAGTCTVTYTAGTYSSAWSTQSESNYLNTYGIVITGTIYNSAITDIAPADLAVIVTCTKYAASGDWDVMGFTNARGQYSLAVGHNGEPMCTYGGYGYFVVEVWNGYNDYWANQWNETIVVWAPQVLNFYVPTSPLSSTPVVAAMEFTHTGAAQVSFCKDTSSTAEFEAYASETGSLFGLSFDETSTSSYSTSFGTSSCVAGQGKPGFEAWGYPHVAGELVFNAIAGRVTSVPWTQYYLPLSNAGSGNATSAPIQDWVPEPTSETGACINSYGAYMFHYQIPAGSATQTFDFYAGGTVSGISGETFGASVPVVLDADQIGTVSYTSGYSITTTLSSEFYASVIIPGPASSIQYFTVACTPSTTSETGIVLHVWQDSGPS